MTQEISKETKLLGIIASQPANDANWCALDRAGEALGYRAEIVFFGETHHDWRTVGTALNFCEGEIIGIMAGWDFASAGLHTFVGRHNEEGFDRGFNLGIRCWGAAQKHAWQMA